MRIKILKDKPMLTGVGLGLAAMLLLIVGLTTHSLFTSEAATDALVDNYIHIIFALMGLLAFAVHTVLYPPEGKMKDTIKGSIGIVFGKFLPLIVTLMVII